VPSFVYFVFRHVWTSQTATYLKNSIRMLFGTNFLGIIPKARLFENPVFVWPNGY